MRQELSLGGPWRDVGVGHNEVVVLESFPPQRIRNVALIGHHKAGKTTLAEALLANAGVIAKRGRVESGNTVCDFEPEEIAHHLSISASLAPFEHKGHKINLVDMPGFADFTHECAGLDMVELAVLVVDASASRVDLDTEPAWTLAEQLGLPRMIFVTALDSDRADFSATLEMLRSQLGAGVAPLELPIFDDQQSLCGVIDLLADKAITYQGGERPKASEGEIPPDVASHEHQVREALVEGIVVADDSLMERYLEGEVPPPEVLEATLGEGVAKGTVYPVVCGSGLTMVGVDRLADFICEIGPPPIRASRLDVQAGGERIEVAPDPDGQTLAVVFKVVADPYLGHIALFRVLSGTVVNDGTLVNTRTGAEVRLHGLFVQRGKEHIGVERAMAGDVAGVGRLGGVAMGDTLAAKGAPASVRLRRETTPVACVALRPRSTGDDDKLMTALHRLEEEDPAISVEVADETSQTLLWGMGDTHLAVVLERLKRKFGVEVDTEPVAVAYRETLQRSGGAEGRHKKQSGGHGQFGVVVLHAERAERGSGLSFEDKVIGGAIPRQYIPAVEKGVSDAMRSGGRWGYPLVDIAVQCLDGKYHPVDSSEAAFRAAGSLALREIIQQVGTVLLEPIVRAEVTVPPAHQGDVLGDLAGRRARIIGTTTEGTRQVITALVPQAEVLGYSSDLRALTSARGTFKLTLDRYDVVPTNVAERIGAKTKA